MLLFILFFCQENHYWEVYLNAYNSLNVTGEYYSESCEKPNDVSAEKIQICNGLIYLDDKTRSLTLLKCVCMYVFIYHRWKIVKVCSFYNTAINKTV